MDLGNDSFLHEASAIPDLLTAHFGGTCSRCLTQTTGASLWFVPLLFSCLLLNWRIRPGPSPAAAGGIFTVVILL